MASGYCKVQEGGQPQAMQGHITHKRVLILDAGKELEEGKQPCNSVILGGRGLLESLKELAE